MINQILGAVKRANELLSTGGTNMTYRYLETGPHTNISFFPRSGHDNAMAIVHLRGNPFVDAVKVKEHGRGRRVTIHPFTMGIHMREDLVDHPGVRLDLATVSGALKSEGYSVALKRRTFRPGKPGPDNLGSSGKVTAEILELRRGRKSIGEIYFSPTHVHGTIHVSLPHAEPLIRFLFAQQKRLSKGTNRLLPAAK